MKKITNSIAFSKVKDFNSNTINSHNWRKNKTHSDNIDIGRIKYNYYSNQQKYSSIKAIMDEKYKEELKKRNSIQTRKDRVLNSFYKEENKKCTAGEFIFQLGNIDLWDGIDFTNQETRNEIIKQYLNYIEKYQEIDNYNSSKPMKILDISIHFDEASPHAHIVYTRETIKEKKGIVWTEPVGTTIPKNEYEEINNKFQDYLAKTPFILNDIEYNIQKRNEDNSLNHLTVQEYKRYIHSYKKLEEELKIENKEKLNELKKEIMQMVGEYNSSNYYNFDTFLESNSEKIINKLGLEKKKEIQKTLLTNLIELENEIDQNKKKLFKIKKELQDDKIVKKIVEEKTNELNEKNQQLKIQISELNEKNNELKQGKEIYKSKCGELIKQNDKLEKNNEFLKTSVVKLYNKVYQFLQKRINLDEKFKAITNDSVDSLCNLFEKTINRKKDKER